MTENQYLLDENIFFLLFIFNIDMIYKFFNTYEQIRWYLIHSLANFYIVISILKPLKLLLQDPIYHIFNPESYYDSTIKIVILHLYHLLFFKCTKDDLFHHVVFVTIGCFTVYFFNVGFFSAFVHFFICGLPGGIDYMFLFMYKMGYITKNTRLKVAMILNVWVRSPGLCMAGSFGILKFIYSEKLLYNYFELFFQVFTSIVNGQMYMCDVVYANAKNNL